MSVYLRWICNAWEEIPKTLIENSFKFCGITNAVDGSEDEMIKCFNENGEVPGGKILLKESRTNDDEQLIDLIDEVDIDQD